MAAQPRTRLSSVGGRSSCGPNARGGRLTSREDVPPAGLPCWGHEPPTTGQRGACTMTDGNGAEPTAPRELHDPGRRRRAGRRRSRSSRGTAVHHSACGSWPGCAGAFSPWPSSSPSGYFAITSSMRSSFCSLSGSLDSFQVLVRWKVTPCLTRISLRRSRLITMRPGEYQARWSASLRTLQRVKGRPSFSGRALAVSTI